MARGKAAAQAAHRRLTEALEKIALLEQRLAEQATAHAAETTALRTELRRAQGVTTREVKAIADAQIAEGRDTAAARVKEARDQHLRQVCEGFAYIEARLKARGTPLSLHGEEWALLSESFGVEFGALVAGSAPNEDQTRRWVRRLTNDMARRKIPLFEPPNGGGAG